MKLLLALCIIVLSGISHAQVAVSTPTIQVSKNIDASDWSIYVESTQLKVEYVKVDCDPNSGMDFEGIMLRFTNLTNNEINLDWHLDLHYDGTCRTCGADEYDRTLTLAPNEIKEGDCNVKTNRTLDLFVKFTDAAYSKGAELTSFNLNNMTVDE
ncbi:MAG: hypothetical protein NXI10_11280 [bacterium]|nr:hypothetical protein [bacterium]